MKGLSEISIKLRLTQRIVIIDIQELVKKKKKNSRNKVLWEWRGDLFLL